ncbi:ComF family protein [Flavobacterium sp. Sd200]|uniref:ComF family protein n=1 Tax=Flavobacterium sp. Sd200 TaxID=2692211 RepID=UPI00136AA4A8|nr:ComF family protein [Flavobacterium sp. Sd200]MXN91320.1 ComF family protein [Flavobacterium sp. Sd200]
MFKSLVNLFFPATCAGCDALLLEGEPVVCTTCRHELPFTRHHLDSQNETTKRFYGRLPLEHSSALLYFHKEGIVQELVHNLKYRGQQQVGGLMGSLYAPQLKSVPALQSVTDIIPVPLHPKKLRERGYNQVTEFGKTIAAILGVAYTDDVLLRNTYNKTQTLKNRELRAGIINSAFAVNYNDVHHNKHFLLVDDVITTGATLEACGKLLLQIPGAKLSIVTIAYAHS